MNDTTTETNKDKWLADGAPFPGLELDISPEEVLKYFRIKIITFSDPSKYIFEEEVKDVSGEDDDIIKHYYAAAGHALFNEFIIEAIEAVIEREEMEKYEQEYKVKNTEEK